MSPTRRYSELLPVPTHDRGGWFKTNTDSPALIDIGAFGGDPPQDIFRGQYRRQCSTRARAVQFESLDKLQALYNSAPYKDAIAVGDKYARQRIFGAEGVSP